MSKKSDKTFVLEILSASLPKSNTSISAWLAKRKRNPFSIADLIAAILACHHDMSVTVASQIAHKTIQQVHNRHQLRQLLQPTDSRI